MQSQMLSCAFACPAHVQVRAGTTPVRSLLVSQRMPVAGAAKTRSRTAVRVEAKKGKPGFVEDTGSPNPTALVLTVLGVLVVGALAFSFLIPKDTGSESSGLKAFSADESRATPATPEPGKTAQSGYKSSNPAPAVTSKGKN